MKQGNSESAQTPDFVCFRKVVHVQGQPSEFRMFSRKKNWIFEKNSDFLEEKNGIFEKNSDLRKKSRDFVFPGMFHNNFVVEKIGNGHGAIISSSP